MQENQRKSRNFWLLAALGLAIAGSMAMCTPKKTKLSLNELARLDKRAQIHFDQARKAIPATVRKITEEDGVVSLGMKMMKDEVFGGHRTEDYLVKATEPVTKHCREGAAVYGCRIDEGGTRRALVEDSHAHGKSAAYAASSLALEGAFIRSTMAATGRVIGATVGKMAASTAAGAACAAADGPFPIGDAIGVAIAGAGTAMSIHDLATLKGSLKENLTDTLNASVTDCQNSCRTAVKR